ncbi:hypothetical protein BC831DRAFT_310536 [Entophlyctis helioformis]|nr:hypothetical protein BC831DRAFT_310536 [Entophlyctis helioformis]
MPIVTEKSWIVHTSPYADVAIPDQDIASFVLGSKDVQANLAKPAFIDAATGETITFGDHIRRVQAFASGFVHHLGFKKGDVLAMFSPNSIHYPAIVFGAVAAGGAFSGANPTNTADELAYQLKDSGASILVADPSVLATAKQAAKTAGLRADRVFVLAKQAVDGTRSVFDLMSDKPLPKITWTKDELHNKPAYLCYSSGTTGRSKGVISTHRNIIANMLQVTPIESAGVTPKDVWLGALPFYHVYALQLSLHLAPRLAIPLVVMAKFDLGLLLQSIQKYRLTVLHIVPPIALALAKQPVVDKFDMSSVRRIMSGAAPLGGEITAGLQKRLKVIVTQGYGLTETSPVAVISAHDDTVEGSVGVLVPNMQMRIVDPDTGKDLEFNEPGEIWLRGPNVMKGYHNNVEATTSSIDKDGFFHTGDIGYVSFRNHLFIVDRLKELIKYKGNQVPPAELEAKLLTHPLIADAAVIPTPDEAAGELPLAYVVLKPGAKLTEKEVQAFIAKMVAPHKQLRGGVVFVNEIPKSAAGKILRRLLRQDDAERKKKLKAKL